MQSGFCFHRADQDLPAGTPICEKAALLPAFSKEQNLKCCSGGRMKGNFYEAVPLVADIISACALKSIGRQQRRSGVARIRTRPRRLFGFVYRFGTAICSNDRGGNNHTDKGQSYQ
jgi:hypothetical protein